MKPLFKLVSKLWPRLENLYTWTWNQGYDNIHPRELKLGYDMRGPVATEAYPFHVKEKKICRYNDLCRYNDI